MNYRSKTWQLLIFKLKWRILLLNCRNILNRPQCKEPLHLIRKDIKLIKEVGRMSIPGVIKTITNQGTPCFPICTIQIGVIIQTLCGRNLNKFNTKHIGSHMRSSIQVLCNHHSLPRNNSNQLQVRQWIMIQFLMN